jgi:tRNA threonylcarbamoyladenosine biosynthesis protein TsaE
MWTVSARDVAETRALGSGLASVAKPGTVVALVGDLGAGKTSFAQGVGTGLGVDTSVVSPTFVLMTEHAGRMPMLHADTYRLSADELPGTGIAEAIDGWPGVALIEWADRFPDLLPADHVQVHIEFEAAHRCFKIAGTGPDSVATVARWRKVHDGG